MTGRNGAAALLAEAEAAGVKLECRLWADHPERLSDNLRVQLREHQAEVMALLLAPANDAAEAPALPTEHVTERSLGYTFGQDDLPLPGSPERERLDAEQRQAVAGLLQAAMARPPSWADSNAMPGKGAYCRCCGGRRWWCEAIEPKRGWRCWTCHPPVRAGYVNQRQT